MNLRTAIQYTPVLSSHNAADLVEEFYVPLLSNASNYDRVCGYFSSSALSVASSGFSAFCQRKNPRMRLIVGAKLHRVDVEVLGGRAEDISELIVEPMRVALERGNEMPDFERDRLAGLAWMLTEGILSVKVGVMLGPDGEVLPHEEAEFHHKFGILYDGENHADAVYFHGSLNESRRAWTRNGESITVHCSWQDGQKPYVQAAEKEFAQLWGTHGLNRDQDVAIVTLPEAVKSDWIRFFPPRRPDHVGEPRPRREGNRLPSPPRSDVHLHPHQREAIEAWFKNEGRGILEMATGAGKTYTALSVSKALNLRAGNYSTLVLVPYIHLAAQWASEAERFGYRAIIANSAHRGWEDRLSTEVSGLLSGSTSPLLCITTYAGFVLPRFQELINPVIDQSLLVADEVHHFGAKECQTVAPVGFQYRLGLSATPERWFDPDGTKFLIDYFGGTVFSFDLSDAIKAGILTPYDYFPVFVPLEADEAEAYYDLTRKIASMIASQGARHSDLSQMPQSLQIMLLRRARLLSHARGKVAHLTACLRQEDSVRHTIVYSAEGRGAYPTAAFDELQPSEESMTAKLVSLLGRSLGLRCHSFTSNESPTERAKLIARFDGGELQVLVAMRCLDEGVDIPSASHAYILASATSPIQAIQRRGRILRRHSEKKRAVLHDYLCLPPLSPSNVEADVFNIDRGIVRKELLRAVEFARDAENAGAAQSALLPIKTSYNLLDL